MKEDKRTIRIYLIAGVIFAVFAFVAWYFYSLSYSIYLLLTAILPTFISITFLTRPIKNNVIVRFYDIIFGWILGILGIVATIFLAIMLIYMSIVLVWIIVSLLLAQIFNIAEYIGVISFSAEIGYKPIVYLSSLITAFVLSFFGDRVVNLNYMFLSFGDTKKDDVSKNLALRFLKVLNFRRRIYEVSIILYITSVVEKLIEKTLFNIEFWITYRTIALEVLLTFIAIDTYIRNYMNLKRD